MVPGASPVGSTTTWRRHFGSIFLNGISGRVKFSSVNDAYIRSGEVTWRSTLILGRIEPVVMSSTWYAGISSAVMSIERVQPAPAKSADEPRPRSAARREIVSGSSCDAYGLDTDWDTGTVPLGYTLGHSTGASSILIIHG